jgi:hypothetical protein
LSNFVDISFLYSTSTTRLATLLADVHEQQADPTLTHFPRHIMVYATAALAEFAAVGQSYRRLQIAAGIVKENHNHSKTTGRTAVTTAPVQPSYMRVLIPFLSFDIGGDDKSSSSG